MKVWAQWSSCWKNNNPISFIVMFQGKQTPSKRQKWETFKVEGHCLLYWSVFSNAFLIYFDAVFCHEHYDAIFMFYFIIQWIFGVLEWIRNMILALKEQGDCDSIISTPLLENWQINWFGVSPFLSTNTRVYTFHAPVYQVASTPSLVPLLCPMES